MAGPSISRVAAAAPAASFKSRTGERLRRSAIAARTRVVVGDRRRLWPLSENSMTVQLHRVSIFLTALAVFAAAPADAQPAPTCIENSPERRGAIGCSNVEN